MRSATVDDRRRLVMPYECPPGAAVTIRELDNNTWIVKRQLPSQDFKAVVFPVVDHLPNDPEWEKVEEAFARHAAKNLPEPEE